jgi:hypothetical protein
MVFSVLVGIVDETEDVILHVVLVVHLFIQLLKGTLYVPLVLRGKFVEELVFVH